MNNEVLYMVGVHFLIIEEDVFVSEFQLRKTVAWRDIIFSWVICQCTANVLHIKLVDVCL